MRAGQQHRAALAGFAGIEGFLRPLLAKHGLGELQGQRPLADARRAGEEKAAGQPPAAQRAAKHFDDPIVSFDAVPTHGDSRLPPSRQSNFSTAARSSACTCSTGRAASITMIWLGFRARLDAKALAHAGVKLGPLLLHAVEGRLDPRGGRVGRHVQQQRQLGHQSAGGHAAHLQSAATSMPPP